MSNLKAEIWIAFRKIYEAAKGYFFRDLLEFQNNVNRILIYLIFIVEKEIIQTLKYCCTNITCQFIPWCFFCQFFENSHIWKSFTPTWFGSCSWRCCILSWNFKVFAFGTYILAVVPFKNPMIGSRINIVLMTEVMIETKMWQNLLSNTYNEMYR